MQIRAYVMALAALLLGSDVAAATEQPRVKVVESIPGPDGGWDYASFDPSTRTLFVARTSGVMAFDARSGKVTGEFAPGTRVHAVLPLPGGRELLTTNGGDDTARFIDIRTGTTDAVVPTSKGPDAAVYDPATRRVFVADGASGRLTIIDPVTHKSTGAIDVGLGLEFAVVDGKGRLFVNVDDKNEIAVVDTLRARVETRYPLSGCAGPTGLAYTENGLLIAACANGVAEVLTSSGRPVASLKIGARPDAVIYDPARRRAYVPCGGDGVLAVLSVDRHSVSVVETVSTERGGRTGAVDPETGRIYIPTARFNAPSAPGKRPTVAPGSFHVLVLATR